MKTREYWPPGVIRFDPKEMYEKLPEEVRGRVSPSDFGEILVVMDAFSAAYATLDRQREMRRYLKDVDAFVAEFDVRQEVTP